MTVKEMIVDYLKEHGYGGLVNTEVPCGCIIGDLAPCCDEIGDQCEAGYVHYCDLCPLVVKGEDGRLESNGCDVEDHPGEGDYCVGVHMEVHPREPDPPKEPWITDAKLQDTVEFWYGVLLNEKKMTGVVKMIEPDHRTLGVHIEGQVKMYWVTAVTFIRIVGADGMSDVDAPADFAAVKAQKEKS